MKSGTCPKCSAENVHVVPGNRIELAIPNVKIFSAGAFLNLYFCGDCGFVETYVEKKEDLLKIAACWPKVFVKS